MITQKRCQKRNRSEKTRYSCDTDNEFVGIGWFRFWKVTNNVYVWLKTGE